MAYFPLIITIGSNKDAQSPPVSASPKELEVVDEIVPQV